MWSAGNSEADNCIMRFSRQIRTKRCACAVGKPMMKSNGRSSATWATTRKGRQQGRRTSTIAEPRTGRGPPFAARKLTDEGRSDKRKRCATRKSRTSTLAPESIQETTGYELIRRVQRKGARVAVSSRGRAPSSRDATENPHEGIQNPKKGENAQIQDACDRRQFCGPR